jgi:hypothetical protein
MDSGGSPSTAGSLRVLREVRLPSGPELAGPAWLTDEDSQEPVRFSYPVSATLCKAYGGLAGWLHRRWSRLGTAADCEPGGAAKSGSGAGLSPFPLGPGKVTSCGYFTDVEISSPVRSLAPWGRHRRGRCVRIPPPLRLLVTSRTGSSLRSLMCRRLGRRPWPHGFSTSVSEVPFVYFGPVRRLVCGLVFHDVLSVRASLCATGPRWMYKEAPDASGG